MANSSVSEQSRRASDPILSRQTLDRIDQLLVEHEREGKVRGLYSIKDLKDIRTHLIELAGWLQDNPPAFMKKYSEGYDKHDRFNEKTVLCISYVDHVLDGSNDRPAIRLQKFYNKHLASTYSHLHILPHFKSPIIHEKVKGPAARADGGFEAMDYKMDPYFGTPDDLADIDAELMLDFVLNHLAVDGEWFQKFLEDEPGYEDFFVTIPEDKIKDLDWEKIFRPREHNPIIPYTNSKGVTKHVWCTFSATQADINLGNPKVFSALMEALIKDFVAQNSSWIRLDAIGYMIKMFGLKPREASTTCFGIEETHNILKVMRSYLDDIVPSVTLVPEVNATADVIKTYYGDDLDEGHLVYEFPSAPLSLHTIYQENANSILEWAQARTDNPELIGLAFTSSHDGVGVLPMRDVAALPDGTPALKDLLHNIESRGGGINYKSKVVDGEQVRVPYEACITWLQAVLSPPEKAALLGDRLNESELDEILARFMASQSFIYSAPHCVPADYIGGVITGLLNDDDLYNIAGHRRNKNRGLVQAEEFDKALNDPKTSHDFLRARIFNAKNHMIETRKKYKSFSPHASCEVDVVKQKSKAKPIYSILRHSPDENETMLALTNCSEKPQKCEFSYDDIRSIEDVLDCGASYKEEAGKVLIKLAPYQVAWLKIVT